MSPKVKFAASVMGLCLLTIAIVAAVFPEAGKAKLRI